MCKNCGTCSKEHGNSIDDSVDEVDGMIVI
jgi:hypothetical protein